MNTGNSRHIFFVDDETEICQVVAATFKQQNFKVTCFTCASDCIKHLTNGSCDLLIAELRLPKMDGLELLRHTKLSVPCVPVLIISGYSDIQTAVKCIKAGATDFIEKPLELHSFVHKIKSIIQSNGDHCEIGPAKLTNSEKRVLKLVLDGHSNKDIAKMLCRSRRTIEVHRTNAMHKLGADNLIELLKRAFEIGLVKPWVDY